MMRSLRTAPLSLVAIGALGLLWLMARDVRSEDNQPNPLEGAWKMIVQKNGDAPDYQKLPDGTEEIKYVTGGRFVWMVIQDHRITSAAGGKYTVDKDKYTETIEFSHGEGQASIVGKTFDFTWKLDGGIWLHVGTIKVNDQDLKIDEKWEKCK
jgi:hypothetical protein